VNRDERTLARLLLAVAALLLAAGVWLEYHIRSEGFEHAAMERLASTPGL